MVTQLEEKYRPAMASLYREIIMAEMVIFSSNDDSKIGEWEPPPRSVNSDSP